MGIRGRRLAASCIVGSFVLIGVAAPASADSDQPPPGGVPVTNDVLVLALTTGDGSVTDLATPTAGTMSGSGDATAVHTSELDVPEFYVAGVTWDGTEVLDEQISIRVANDDEWTDWADLEPDEVNSGDVGGTEPYIVGGATGVQLRVGAGETDLPANLRLHLIPAEPAEEERYAQTDEDVSDVLEQAETEQPSSASMSTPAPTRTAANSPQVITRSGWAADESLMRWTPRNRTLRAAVVHHTAGQNNYTAAQSPAIVRGIYRYHAVTRGWGDIGYNFLVDKYGQIFEGRSGSYAAPNGRMPQAAHALGFNDGTLGISVLGDYSSVYAPNSVLDTMAEVIAWKFDAAGIDMSTRSGMISPGTSARPAGQNLPRIYAHRDVGATTCPGNNIYARIPALNNQVESLMREMGEDEYHLRNSLSGGPAHLTVRLGLSTDEAHVGDWNGDGKDTIALRRGTRYLAYDSHPGRSFREIRYGRADDVVLVGDWNGDGRDTLAVRRGSQYHVKNSMTGGDADVVLNYGRADDVVLVGDWNGNGRDTFAVRRGAQYHVRNSLTSGDANVVFTYGRSDDVVLVGDWNGNGSDTFGVRRSN